MSCYDCPFKDAIAPGIDGLDFVYCKDLPDSPCAHQLLMDAVEGCPRNTNTGINLTGIAEGRE